MGECRCSRLSVGMTVTESRNWNPDCAEHGTTSVWWNTPEQKQKRETDRLRLEDLWAQVRAARKKARDG